MTKPRKRVNVQKELILVDQGGTVTQKASSHLFVIALAKRQGHVQEAAGSIQGS